jgi:hypothetical protein
LLKSETRNSDADAVSPAEKVSRGRDTTGLPVAGGEPDKALPSGDGVGVQIRE